MRTRKPLAVRIFIRICVFFMALSLIAVYVVYMFPQEEVGEDTQGTNIDTGFVEELSGIVDNSTEIDNGTTEENQIVLPEVNPDEPENTGAPILINEGGEIDEMDQTFEVQLENGETELIRQGDLGDSIQID